MTNEIDPRPFYERALTWAGSLVVDVDPALLDGPTPCSEYDVRALLGHLVATVDRARVIGEGANLGVTQRGRIEAAQKGIKLNTENLIARTPPKASKSNPAMWLYRHPYRQRTAWF